MPFETEVAIIGAGAAGIAAGQELTRQGVRNVILEARSRLGGRCFTDARGLDHGAAWLHQPNENPLRFLAYSHGQQCTNHDAVVEHFIFSNGRFLLPPECAAVAAANEEFWQDLKKVAKLREQDGPASIALRKGSRWERLIADWEGPHIYGADLCDISLKDMLATAVSGGNHLVRGGLGNFVAQLAQDLDVRLSAEVKKVSWKGSGVCIEGDFGVVRAEAVIVTVPSKIIALEKIQFDPPLPPSIIQAASDLPLGLLNKIAFSVSQDTAQALNSFSCLRREPLFDGDRPMSWIARPFGAPMIIGFIGGPLAWALSNEGTEAAIAFAKSEFGKIFGAAEARKLGQPILTDWGNDPYALGSYSHARPGAQAARSLLATPVEEGRLVFAGEACHPRFASTVAGAWLSGEQAAADLWPRLASAHFLNLGRF